MLERPGGWGWALADLPPPIIFPVTVEENVIELARPLGIDELFKQRLANDIRAMVLRDLSDVVLRLAVEVQQGRNGVGSVPIKKAAAS